MLEAIKVLNYWSSRKDGFHESDLFTFCSAGSKFDVQAFTIDFPDGSAIDYSLDEDFTVTMIGTHSPEKKTEEKTAAELLEMLQESGFTFNETFLIKADFQDLDSWMESEESKEYYREYENVRRQDKHFWEHNKYDFADHKFYVTESNVVFHTYTLVDSNLKMCQRINVSFSCISDSPFEEVNIFFDKVLTISHRSWATTKANRKIIADQGRMVIKL